MMKRILFLLFAFLPLYIFGQVQDVNVGSSPDDGTGDNLRNAFIKVNSNFDYIDLIKLDSGDVAARINDTANILRLEISDTASSVRLQLRSDINDTSIVLLAQLRSDISDSIVDIVSSGLEGAPQLSDGTGGFTSIPLFIINDSTWYFQNTSGNGYISLNFKNINSGIDIFNTESNGDQFEYIQDVGEVALFGDEGTNSYYVGAQDGGVLLLSNGTEADMGINSIPSGEVVRMYVHPDGTTDGSEIRMDTTKIEISSQDSIVIDGGYSLGNSVFYNTGAAKLGGYGHSIIGNGSVVIGGFLNQINANYSGIYSSGSSFIDPSDAFIIGGRSNNITASDAGGDLTAIINSEFSVISGTSSQKSTIYNCSFDTINNVSFASVFGTNNKPLSSYEFIIGKNSTRRSGRIFNIGFGDNSSNLADLFTIMNNGNTEINGNLNVSDTIYNENNPAVKIHRIANLNVTVANSWQNVKFDTLIQDESTWGFALNADSTGIITNFNGVIAFAGCSHWDWNGAAGTSVKIYTRVVQDGVELRCSQANDTRTAGSGDNASLRYGGSVNVAPGDVLRLQYYVTNVALDFEGDAVFDDGIAFTFQAAAKTLQP